MEAQPWDRQPGESALWYSRFTRYRLMQPVRKIPLVFQEEQAEQNRGNQRKEPPGVWYEIAHQFRWLERAQAWDAHLDAELEQNIAAERKKVLSTRFALMHERVKYLDALAGMLITDVGKKGKLYRREIRIVGSGKDARPVEVELFEEGLVREIRGCLADIAAELGERVKMTKQEITGKDGKPLIPEHNELLAALSDEEFEQLKQLQATALARLEQDGNGTTAL